ncbi:hypothetical protein QQ045_001012 [Rhodiola kirilowii]
MLNPDKSKVFFSEGIGGTRRKTILDITKFKEGKFPVIYLGAPLFSGRAKISYFKYLEDVVKGEIASSAKNFLLLSGRATLILSVLSSVKGVLRGVVDNFLLTHKPDSLLWRGCDSGSFSTKACYDKIRKSLPKSTLFKHSWHYWLPLKISAFIWRLWYRALPTDDNVIRIGFDMVSKCWCCKNSRMENLEHIFIESDLTTPIRNYLGILFGLEVTCIQASHPDVGFLGLDAFAGSWAHFKRWREARKLLGQTKVTKIGTELNDTAIALCFKEATAGIFYSLRELPKPIHVALTCD